MGTGLHRRDLVGVEVVWGDCALRIVGWLTRTRGEATFVVSGGRTCESGVGLVCLRDGSCLRVRREPL